MTGAEEVELRRGALRALLAKPLLTAEHDAEALLKVRRCQRELREWLTRETGWRLHVEAGVARLFKTVSATSDSTHPARGRAREPFGRRRYVVLCLALSVLERADAQTTLGRLADEVLTAAAEPDLDFSFPLESRAERTDLVAVVRLLIDWGVLRRVAGEEESYLSASGDVLYDVRREVLSRLLTGTRGPSTVEAATLDERLSALVAVPLPDTDDLRNQALRRALTRRLLDEPVVYHTDLTEAERAYLTSQRHAITRRIEQATGLIAEIRAEGVAMVDPHDELTDIRMPEQRTDGHLTLLVAEHLAEHGTVPLDALHAFVRAAARAHQTYWRKGVTEPGAETELLAGVLDRLTALRLAEIRGSSVAALPAISRYALAEPTVKEPR
ncbi:TIGR02678 family protein [Actinocorallia sp. API 0066]|uniref:TIGR02678 family protein n=1 Tax=Actinocorallia sp. API 0066 TaxID=2896846 RepID=UPI001E5B21DE|nr:TIGR02678 family protein [Actinocorallia sp. API 0066]MCD0450479.1 TIGR02678 family protein [Actinocorallia sp. API 0066]